MKFKTQKNKIYKSGFSLIEMLVAVGVFAVAAAIAVEALLAVSDAQQKILSLRIAQDNVSYAVDIMSKEIRTGISYHCGSDISLIPQDCPSGGFAFTFLNASGQTVTYRLDASGQRLEVSKNAGGNWQFLTSPDLIIIDQLLFYTIGAPAGDTLQPRLTIVLRGMAGSKIKTKSQLNLQTTISQRQLDS